MLVNKTGRYEESLGNLANVSFFEGIYGSYNVDIKLNPVKCNYEY